MNPLATSRRKLHDMHVSGANWPETSRYGPLANLPNDIGRALKPPVRCLVKQIFKVLTNPFALW